MKARIVRIGNSRGIRIPKSVLEQTGLDGDVEVTVKDRSIVITAATAPRVGWDESFKDMARRDDDRLLDDVPRASTWDEDEWEW